MPGLRASSETGGRSRLGSTGRFLNSIGATLLVPLPPLGSMLLNHTIAPDGGADTMFASTYAAYEALWDHWPNVRAGFRVQIEGMQTPQLG